jgi:CCR4-NOT complex subunit CAF16
VEMLHEGVISVSGLSFTYKGRKSVTASGQRADSGPALVIDDLRIYRGERVVLCGKNGAGKSSMMAIMGGKKHIPGNEVQVLGRHCFNDCTLSRNVCYLGDWWRTDFFLDVTIHDFLGTSVVSSPACQQLVRVLQVDLQWRISYLSDGQRRRCQILAALTASDQFEIYVLDEVTADLDIVSRENLLLWLREQAETRHATVLLATHIFDGLHEWTTRLIYMERGCVKYDLPVSDSSPLYSKVRRWMIDDV